MFMYICVYIELMKTSVSLVDVTKMDLQKNKKWWWWWVHNHGEDYSLNILSWRWRQQFVQNIG